MKSGDFKNAPEKGDFVWLTFDPNIGREQKGHRPALVLSPVSYNRKTGLAVFCPVTSKIKGYPFEVRIKTNKIDGVILSDQVKSLCWTERNCKYISKCPEVIFEEVSMKISLLLGNETE
jgi:mRNA interferase MazF